MAQYVLPQVQVFQIFRMLPTAVVRNLNAFVFGPNYRPMRYSEAAERDLIGLGAYDNAQEVSYAYPSQPSGSVVDQDAVRLFFENAWLRYFDGTAAAAVPANDELNKLRFNPPAVLKAGNGYSRSAAFYSRDVAVGDGVRFRVAGSTEYAESRVVALEADVSAAAVGGVEEKAANPESQAATDLDAGADIVEAAAGNAKAFDGVATLVHELDDSAGRGDFSGAMSAGLITDDISIEITAGGAAGAALATVRSASGSYVRTNVPIEATGGNDGQIYVGRNAYVNFHRGALEDGVFVVGDVYTVKAIQAAYVKVDNATSGGTYTGPADTTYIVSVDRGGMFNRAVGVSDGLSNPARYDLDASIDWAQWTGGDRDDEYILRCTSAGTAATAVFELLSLTGDNQSGVVFGGVDTEVSLGNRGLVGEISEALATGPVFEPGDYWVIKVNASRPRIRISDSAGVDMGSYVVVSPTVAVNLGGFGATIAFPTNANTEGGFVADGGLLRGDVFYVAVTAAAEGAIRTIVMADEMPAGTVTTDDVDVQLFIRRASIEVGSKRVQSPPDRNWETGELEVAINSAIELQDSAWYDGSGELIWMPVHKAAMYLEYRALLLGEAGSIQRMDDIGAVTQILGPITTANPLAQGVYNAMLNSGDRGVYYCAVRSDDLDGYLGVLDLASVNDDVYAFVPVTRDRQILSAVQSHVDSMSTEENKRWRIAFVGTEMKTVDVVYENGYTATISDDGTGRFRIVDFVDGDPSALTEVRSGDRLRIGFSTDAWGDETYDEYVVDVVLTDSKLRLVSGPAASIDVAEKVEVWHPMTQTEVAQGVAAVSTSFMNRRVYHVFPDRLISGNEVQTAEFGAAAVAGLCSSVPPQQGLTNITVNGFEDLPDVYRNFTRAQLNTMAGSGTLILMQDSQAGQVYVRHQVSSATSEGNLNTRELSITKNLDSVSYYFADRLRPFIGRYNVTPELLDVLRANVDDGIMYLGSFTDVGLLGPQLLLGDALGNTTRIVRIEQHPTLRDNVLIEVEAVLPVPLNVIRFYIVV